MKYFYVGATAEVDRQMFQAIRDQSAADLAGRGDCIICEIELPAVEFAFDANRAQYRSIAVLEMLSRLCPADGWKLLAITERDLFIPVLTFVFGQAQLDGRVAVVSLSRLRQEFYGLPADDGVLLDRARKEVLHEVGHTFGLVHCAVRSCAMSLATSVRHIDLKQAGYCEACGKRAQREAL